MRSESLTVRRRRPLSTSGVVPAAIVGSVALMLSSTPAQAIEPVQDAERTARDLPAFAQARVTSLPSAGLPTVQMSSAPAGVGAGVAAAKSAAKTYTVKRGDTVFAIAARHGLRTADVLALNNLTSRSVIYPGQKLRLSGSSAHTAAAKPAAAASGRYTVRKGDTISAIASRHGVSIQSVFVTNKLTWSSIIYPGQKLTIPGKTASASKPAAPKPAKASTSQSAPASAGSYTIRKGDTISAIASRHGVTISAVLAANKLSWASIIYPGQKIAIPRKGAAAASSSASSAPAKSSTVKLNAEQTSNAKLIIRVGRSLGLSNRAIAIALGTAMQESSLRNLSGGDRDSIGLFQQRPSTGWGTPAQIHNATRSTTVFFGGSTDPNGHRTRGLLDIPGWKNMSFTQAAQAVQISAYPNAYAKWEVHAYAWLAALG